MENNKAAKHQFHDIILFCHIVIMLNFKARALQTPDLLAKGHSADAVPALVWIRYSRIFTCWLRAFKLAQEPLLYFSFLLIFTYHQFHSLLDSSLTTNKDHKIIE